MDLFDIEREKRLKKNAPLSYRVRPKTLDEFVGQEHILYKNSLLYKAIKADRLFSIILYGPPGTGKTTLSEIIANATKSDFIKLNATASGTKEMKAIIDGAKDVLAISGRRTTLFVDEIHRFNKTQQDVLLPHVENGTITLIGATTENPFFEVNSALISRSMLFSLNLLTEENIVMILKRALADKEKGLGNYKIEIDETIIKLIADVAGGDARRSLNLLELATETTERSQDGIIHLTKRIIENCIQEKIQLYDKNQDSHYDYISAFIKSMRGSDPDAALYYLAKMLVGGEDIKFIARRIVICASEDVGNADTNAIQVAVAAAQAVNFIGMPESRIILAQAVTYVASAPKSNATYLGIEEAIEDAKKVTIKTIPPYLKSSSYSGSIRLGNGIGYKYPHNFEGHYVKQQYLPDELVSKRYYSPTEIGEEKKIKENLERLKNL